MWIGKKLKITIMILLTPVVLFGMYLLFMMATDYRPDKAVVLKVENNSSNLVKRNEPLKIVTFNIGYGGLDKNQDFFMDGGTGSRSSSKEKTIENIEGVEKFLKSEEPDFILFQEIDKKSTRSFKVNEVAYMQESFKGYSSSFAVNYKVPWVFVPVTKPHGTVNSGLLTLSKFKIDSSTRYQLPGKEEYFRQLFDLDRCIEENRLPVEGGKELVLINSHLSAYDKGGKVRKVQIEFLKEYLKKEAEKGNYIIIGGDWNHVLPGTNPLDFKTQQPYPDWLKTLPEDFTPVGFKWAVDKDVPSNRAVDVPYEKNVNFLCTIDGFLVSSNIDIKSVKGHNLNFEYTDHNPVEVEVMLR